MNNEHALHELRTGYAGGGALMTRILMSEEVSSHEYDDAAPDASAMIESMRAHGYTLPTAIADLIDNSIAAECRNCR